MRIGRAQYLIVDLEATCSDDGSVPRDEMEIIEIGAVVLDAQSFRIIDEFDAFIRPVRHPRLTDFCLSLTTIQQRDVESAGTFAAAIQEFVEWKSRYPNALFCSWGNFDKSQFQRDCAFHGIPYPFDAGHLNVKEAFSTSQNARRRFGVGEALDRLGLQFEGTPHRGIDDVRNIARIIRRVCFGPDRVDGST